MYFTPIKISKMFARSLDVLGSAMYLKQTFSYLLQVTKDEAVLGNGVFRDKKYYLNLLTFYFKNIVVNDFNLVAQYKYLPEIVESVIKS